MLAIVINSFVTGSVYALMALGLVAVHKTTRIFNFAHGHMASVGGYTAYVVTKDWGAPFLVGVAAGVLMGMALGLAIDRLLLWRLYHRSPVELVVVTVGVGMLIQAFVSRQFGDDPLTIPEPLAGRSVTIFGAHVPAYGLIVFAVALTAVAAISLVLARTRVGLRLRVTFDDPLAARMVGINVSAVRSFSWILGGGLAGLGGVLLAPILYLTPDSMSTVLLAAFAAAVIGGFSSFYGAIVGGIVLALVTNLFGAYISAGMKSVFMFAFLVLFLVVWPTGLLGEREAPHTTATVVPRRVFAGLRTRLARVRMPAGWSRWSGTQLALLAVALVTILLANAAFGVSHQFVLLSWLSTLIASAGVALVLFYGGRITFAQNGFMALGAYFTAKVLSPHPAQWLWILPAAAVVAGVVGYLFALLTRRLESTYFALATLALGLLVPELAVKWNSFTGGGQGMAVGAPTWPSGERLSPNALYAVSATAAAVVLVGLVLIRNTAVGRTFVAVRDNARGAQSLGFSAPRRETLIFAVGSALGGLAGGLIAMTSGIVTPSSYSFNTMLLLFVAVIVAGSLVGAIWGAALVALVPTWLQDQPEYANFIFGVVVLLVVHLLPTRREATDVITLPLPAQLAYPPSDAPAPHRGTPAVGVPSPS